MVMEDVFSETTSIETTFFVDLTEASLQGETGSLIIRTIYPFMKIIPLYILPQNIYKKIFQ